MEQSGGRPRKCRHSGLLGQREHLVHGGPHGGKVFGEKFADVNPVAAYELLRSGLWVPDLTLPCLRHQTLRSPPWDTASFCPMPRCVLFGLLVDCDQQIPASGLCGSYSHSKVLNGYFYFNVPMSLVGRYHSSFIYDSQG